MHVPTTQNLEPGIKEIRVPETYTPGSPEIPQLEDDNSEQDKLTDAEYLDHHNTHKESERIRREYLEKFQYLSDDEYYAEVDHSIGFQYQVPEPAYYNTSSKSSRYQAPTNPNKHLSPPCTTEELH